MAFSLSPESSCIDVRLHQLSHLQTNYLIYIFPAFYLECSMDSQDLNRVLSGTTGRGGHRHVCAFYFINIILNYMAHLLLNAVMLHIK